MKGFLVIVLLVCSSCALYAYEYHFDFNPELHKAYDRILNLRLKEAQMILDDQKRIDPKNATIYFVEDYIDFFTVFINEDHTEFQILEKNKKIRLDILEDSDPSSPYHLYAQAEVRLHWALARLKFKEYKTAFFEVRKAYNQLEKNQEKFPRFIANKKSLGVLHAVIGNIPDSYKWGVKLIGGMDGDINLGLKELEEVLTYSKSNNFLFEEETLVMYSFLVLHLDNQKDKAWKVVNSSTSSHMDANVNPLACFIKASIAMSSGRNDDAIYILRNKPKGDKYHPFYYLDYLHGLALLRKLDPNSSHYLLRYIHYFKGKNYIKEAYQKLAWLELIHGNMPAYESYMEKCKYRGATEMEEDNQAYKEAKSGVIPDAKLLKIRLLYDGGYYVKASELIGQYSVGDFDRQDDRIEFWYRKGRVYHALNQKDKALPYYHECIRIGSTSSVYYYTAACIQAAHIYADKKDTVNAKTYYKRALQSSPSEYKNSLHAKAKAGIDRLK